MVASAAAVATYRQAQTDVTTLAFRELDAQWRMLDTSHAPSAVRALEEFLPELIQAYGEIGAAVAADYYEDLRESSPAIRQAYAAVMADAIPLDTIQKNVGWAVKPMFQGNPDGALGRVLDITDRLVKGQGRQTVETNVVRDPARARYARVPTGASTCAFCLTMASRGAVYLSEASASKDYHGHCDCAPTPMWDGDAYPEGYDPDSLYETYKRARRQTDSDSLKGGDGILAALRKEEGIK